MNESVFLPNGKLKLVILILIVAFVAGMSYALKYWLIAGLFGITVPGWNS